MFHFVIMFIRWFQFHCLSIKKIIISPFFYFTRLGRSFFWSKLQWRSQKRPRSSENRGNMAKRSVLNQLPDCPGVMFGAVDRPGFKSLALQVQTQVIQNRQKQKKAMLSAVKKYQKGTFSHVYIITAKCFHFISFIYQYYPGKVLDSSLVEHIFTRPHVPQEWQINWTSWKEIKIRDRKDQQQKSK